MLYIKNIYEFYTRAFITMENVFLRIDVLRSNAILWNAFVVDIQMALFLLTTIENVFDFG